VWQHLPDNAESSLSQQLQNVGMCCRTYLSSGGNVLRIAYPNYCGVSTFVLPLFCVVHHAPHPYSCSNGTSTYVAILICLRSVPRCVQLIATLVEQKYQGHGFVYNDAWWHRTRPTDQLRHTNRAFSLYRVACSLAITAVVEQKLVLRQ